MNFRGVARAAAAVLVAAAAVTTGVAAPQAQAETPPAIMFLMDTSGSMAGAPLDQAKDALNVTSLAVPSSTATGLRSFGGNCSDGGRRLVPVGTGNRAAIVSAANGLQASGETPTPAAIRAAAGDLPAGGKRTVVLISDGVSTCGDPCPTAKEIKNRLGVDFVMNTVGFNTSTSATNELKCIANSTGGRYVPASNTADLALAMVTASMPQLTPEAILKLVTGLLSTIDLGSVQGSLGG